MGYVGLNLSHHHLFPFSRDILRRGVRDGVSSAANHEKEGPTFLGITPTDGPPKGHLEKWIRHFSFRTPTSQGESPSRVNGDQHQQHHVDDGATAATAASGVDQLLGGPPTTSTTKPTTTTAAAESPSSLFPAPPHRQLVMMI